MYCPEIFGGCACLSGAFNFFAPKRFHNLQEWKGIFGYDLKDPGELQGSKYDVYALVRRNAENGVKFPKLYLWCGTADLLLDDSRQMSVLFRELGIPHLYTESEGDHSWKWWDLHIQDALNYLLER